MPNERERIKAYLKADWSQNSNNKLNFHQTFNGKIFLLFTAETWR